MAKSYEDRVCIAGPGWAMVGECLAYSVVHAAEKGLSD
jgi:hypothetical protein